MSLPPSPPTLVTVFQAVLEASWQGSLAILLVGLVRQVLGARVPARWWHALWLLVLVRLLVPGSALPHSPASLQNVPVLNHPIRQSGRRLQAPHDADNGGSTATATSAVGPRRLAADSGVEGSGRKARKPEVASSKTAASGWSL